MSHGLLDRADRFADSVSIFTPTGGATLRTWTKPRWARMVQIFCLGPGGNGGTGQTGATGIGGGGGGGGGLHIGIFSALLLPDMLHIQVGVPGGNTYVAVSATGFTGLANGNVLAQGQTGSAGTGGGGGGGAGGGGNGAGGSQWLLWAAGMTNNYSGQSGGAGGNQANGTAVAPSNSSVITGGGGGAGHQSATDKTGGGITAPQLGWEPLIASLVGGATLGGNGDPGMNRMRPFIPTGGCGAGSAFGGTGGIGGNGGWGCGGGGGGSGGTAGGAGGRGGDGLVIITVV